MQRSTFAWSEDVDLTMAGDSYARNVVIAPSVEWRSDHSSAELSVNENLPDFARKSRGNRAHMPGKGAAEPTGHSKQVRIFLVCELQGMLELVRIWLDSLSGLHANGLGFRFNAAI